MSVEIFGQKVYLAGSRSHRGEWMIVATNQKPFNAIEIYLRRWEVETLFANLKTKGFRFEDTHITDLKRLEKIMGLLAMGLAWAHRAGEFKALIKPIVFNQYRESKRPQFSYFRYGLDFIREALLKPYQKQKQINLLFQILIYSDFNSLDKNL